MTVIVKDGEIHVSDPDENKVTHCGIGYTHNNTEKIRGGGHYIDQQLADVRTEYPDADECEECIAEATH